MVNLGSYEEFEIGLHFGPINIDHLVEIGEKDLSLKMRKELNGNSLRTAEKKVLSAHNVARLSKIVC